MKPEFWTELLDDFLADNESGWSETTRDYYRARLRPFMNFLTRRKLGSPDQITLRDINRFLAELRQAKLSWSTRNGTHTALSLFFRWLRRARLVERDIFNDPESALKRPKKPRRVKVMVEHASAKALIRVAKADPSAYGRRDEAIMLLLYSTGLRRVEVVNLRLRDFDPQSRKLVIRGKGDHQRVIFVRASVAGAIRRWTLARPKTRDLALFVTLRPHQGGKFTKMNPNRINRLIERRREEAGLPDLAKVNPHAWRHRYGSDFAAAGGNAFVLQELMGHSDISITREYVQFNEATLRKMSDLYSPGKDLESGEEEESK